MNKVSRWIAMMGVLAMGVALGLYLQRPADAQDRPEVKLMAPKVAATKWEYKIVSWNPGSELPTVCENKLNKLGDEGFEIAAIEAHQQFGAFYYTLKRIKKD